MKRLLWSGVAVAACVIASGHRAAAAQGATSCDSPCKVMRLPLVGPPGAVCDSPCKMINLPLVQQKAEPIPSSNPLNELQGMANAANRTYFEYQIDKPVMQVDVKAFPPYPDSLRALKIAGEVAVEFAVDTTGVVDPTSFRLLRSTHPLFAKAVRDWLATARFFPAEKKGVKVRQLVQKTFVFAPSH